MTQRERLIEVLSQYFDIGDSMEYTCMRDKSAFAIGTMKLEDFVEFDDEKIADIADYLLSNNIIILPCKIGTTVYLVEDICNFPTDCYTKRLCNGCKYRQLQIDTIPFTFNLIKDIGKTIFLTYEEAEAALNLLKKNSGDSYDPERKID